MMKKRAWPWCGNFLLMSVAVLRPSAVKAEEPSYYADIKPIVDNRCVSCHRTGGIAPLALDDVRTVTRMHRAIAAAVQSRSMPPWMAASGCQDYENDRSLRDSEIATIVRWSQAGGPSGLPTQDSRYQGTVAGRMLRTSARHTPTSGAAATDGLSRVDRELMPREAYQPRPRANDYRCFILDWPESATQYITGVGVQPGRAEIVHHVIAYRVPPQQIAAVEALDEAEAGPGYTCFGGPLTGGANLPQIASWAPGTLGRDLPATTGLKMETGSKIVMQVHYNTEHGMAAADQSKLLFKLDREVENEAFVIPFTNPDWVRNHNMPIPAGAMDVLHRFQAPFSTYAAAVTGGQLPATGALRIYSSGLHMHLLGQSTRLQVEGREGGTRCLLDIPRWDFHWQGSYVLKQPIRVEAGERLSIDCRFNNPGTQDVNWGEGTKDEMCVGFVYVTL